MGIIVTDDKHYKNIASAIREKTNSEETYAPEKMTAGVNEVYDKGRTDELSDFWKSATKLVSGHLSFSGTVWNDETFQPTENIIFARGNGNWLFTANKITSVKTSLAVHGVKFDTSNLFGLGYAFRENATIDLPELDLRGCNGESTTQLSSGLAYNSNLVTIDKIIFPTTWGKISNWNGFLQNNRSLQNIVIEGVIPCSLNLSVSPLSVESMKSIISHLNNYAGTANEFAYTVTFSGACLSVLDAEGATSPNGNLWKEYATDLGWNVN